MSKHESILALFAARKPRKVGPRSGVKLVESSLVCGIDITVIVEVEYAAGAGGGLGAVLACREVGIVGGVEIAIAVVVSVDCVGVERRFAVGGR